MRLGSLALFALLALQVRAYPSGPGPAWGKKVNGLRVGLKLVAGRLEAVLQNGGQKDVVLNVGVMLANGARQYPSAVRVVAIDAKGREHNLVIQPALVAGRLDPLVVPLRAGARYIVPLDLGAAVVQDKGTRLAALATTYPSTVSWTDPVGSGRNRSVVSRGSGHARFAGTVAARARARRTRVV